MTSLLPDRTINKIDIKKTSEESERKRFFLSDVTVKPLKNFIHYFWLKIAVIILLIICIILTIVLVIYW